MAGIGEYNYESFSLEQKFGWMQHGPGPGGGYNYSRSLQQLAADFGASDAEIGSGFIQRHLPDWQGQAAANATDACNKALAALGTSTNTSHKGGGSADQYGGSFAYVKSQISVPNTSVAAAWNGPDTTRYARAGESAGSMFGPVGRAFGHVAGYGAGFAADLWHDHQAYHQADQLANTVLKSHENTTRQAVTGYTVPADAGPGGAGGLAPWQLPANPNVSLPGQSHGVGPNQTGGPPGTGSGPAQAGGAASTSTAPAAANPTPPSATPSTPQSTPPAMPPLLPARTSVPPPVSYAPPPLPSEPSGRSYSGSTGSTGGSSGGGFGGGFVPTPVGPLGDHATTPGARTRPPGQPVPSRTQVPAAGAAPEEAALAGAAGKAERGAGGMPMGGMGAAARGGEDKEHRNNRFIPDDSPFRVPDEDVTPAVLGLDEDEL
jgi:hypothetical protein